MGTVRKQIADDIIAGMYQDDMPMKIVKYRNKWGDETYGLIYAHDNQDRYEASEYVINPTVYWERK